MISSDRTGDGKLSGIFTPVCSTISAEKEKIDYVRVDVEYTYNGIFLSDFYNVMNLKWTGGLFVFVPGSFYTESNKVSRNGENVTYETVNAPESAKQDSLSWSFIPHRIGIGKRSYNGNASFRLEPSTPLYVYTDASKNTEKTEIILNNSYHHRSGEDYKNTYTSQYIECSCDGI